MNDYLTQWRGRAYDPLLGLHSITRVCKIDNPHNRLHVKNGTNDSNFSKNISPFI